LLRKNGRVGKFGGSFQRRVGQLREGRTGVVVRVDDVGAAELVLGARRLGCAAGKVLGKPQGIAPSVSGDCGEGSPTKQESSKQCITRKCHRQAGKRPSVVLIVLRVSARQTCLSVPNAGWRS